jgi:hypothetical protein
VEQSGVRTARKPIKIGRRNRRSKKGRWRRPNTGSAWALPQTGGRTPLEDEDYPCRSAKTPRKDPTARRTAEAAMPLGIPAAGLNAPSHMAAKTKAKSAAPTHQQMSRAGFLTGTGVGGVSASLCSIRSGLSSGEGEFARSSPHSSRPTPGPGIGTPCLAFSASRVPQPLPSAERDILGGKLPEANCRHNPFLLAIRRVVPTLHYL